MFIVTACALNRYRILIQPQKSLNHPIDIKSPLWGLTEEDLKNGEAEFLLFMKAYDENFSQMVNIRSSYTYNEVVWGAKWQSMIGKPEDGKVVLLMDKIGAYDRVPLPELNLNFEDDAADKQQHPATQMHQPGVKPQAK